MIIYLGQTLSEEPHISLSQQLERPKIPKQLPAVDDGSLKTKTDIVPKKMQLRPSPGKSAIPVAHHTIPKSKGEKSVYYYKNFSHSPTQKCSLITHSVVNNFVRLATNHILG